jgi:hypothetical protein
MNFKTTVVLIVLLAVAVGTLWFTREKEGDADRIAEDKKQKLFDIAANDVHKVVVTPADGKRMSLEKSDGKWRLTEPVTAAAESFEVDNLVRALTELESRGEVDSENANAEATGLDTPRFVVDISTADGKTHTLNVGDKPAVGDIVYVARKDRADETLVVPADLLERLDKPAADYREKKLVDVSTGDVRQITLEKPSGKIVIARSGTGDWKITEPKAMPAEKTEVDDILFALTGLRAAEFVSEDGSEAASYGLAKPRIRATISSTQPVTHSFVTTARTTTAGATSQPAPLVINFGDADLLQQNVMVSTSRSPVIAKVGATVIETIDKKPIELRDKRVADIDPAQVSWITIASDLAATTRPTSRPASKKEVVVRRARAPDAQAQATTAPAATRAATQPGTRPGTQASTQSATTQATTQAAATQPAPKWEVAGGNTSQPADDSKVDALLGQLHPLRAQKYLESAPTTQPTATYVIRITTVAPGGAEAKHEIKLVDPGDTKPLLATYNELAFEADRSLADRLSGDFLKGSSPSPAAGQSFGNDPDAAPFPAGP